MERPLFAVPVSGSVQTVVPVLSTTFLKRDVNPTHSRAGRRGVEAGCHFERKGAQVSNGLLRTSEGANYTGRLGRCSDKDSVDDEMATRRAKFQRPDRRASFVWAFSALEGSRSPSITLHPSPLTLSARHTSCGSSHDDFLLRDISSLHIVMAGPLPVECMYLGGGELTLAVTRV